MVRAWCGEDFSENNFKSCVCSRSKQMPYTDQILDIASYVSTFLWVNIEYKYHDFTIVRSITLGEISFRCFVTSNNTVGIFMEVIFLKVKMKNIVLFRTGWWQIILVFASKSKLFLATSSMDLVLKGNSEIGAQVRSYFDYLI